MQYDTDAAAGRGEQLASRVGAATSKESALWLLEKLVPESGINNIGFSLRVNGRLRFDALRTSMAIVLGRYRILRTVFFATDANLVKELVPEGEFEVEIEHLKLSDGQTEKDLVAFVGRPFDLDGRALIRAGLAVCPDGDIFCIAVHHLVFDGTSTAIFMRALISVYEAVAALSLIHI